MSEELPGPMLDEPAGDVADQASRLQMAQEQEAIRAALAGRVSGTDAFEDRGPEIAPLEGADPLDGDSADASDDPVHGGGMPSTDPSEVVSSLDSRLGSRLDATGLVEDGAAMAVEEGSSVEDDDAVHVFEQDGDPDVVAEDLTSVDDEAGAEDLDALRDVLEGAHDPDDPRDPDGYGVPPARDARGWDEDAPQTD